MGSLRGVKLMMIESVIRSVEDLLLQKVRQTQFC